MPQYNAADGYMEIDRRNGHAASGGGGSAAESNDFSTDYDPITGLPRRVYKSEPCVPGIDPNIVNAFKKFDADGDGFLDYRELRAALASMGLDVSDADSKAMLNAYDDNPDGKMDMQEFAKLIGDLQAGTVRPLCGPDEVDVVVIIPEGLPPKTPFQVTTPGGGVLSILPPDGSKPGDELRVRLPTNLKPTQEGEQETMLVFVPDGVAPGGEFEINTMHGDKVTIPAVASPGAQMLVKVPPKRKNPYDDPEGGANARKVMAAQTVNENDKLFDKMTSLFAEYDADGDGSITPAELRKILRAAKPDAPDNVIERAAAHAMHKGDTNRDGSIDFEEFGNVYNLLVGLIGHNSGPKAPASSGPARPSGMSARDLMAMLHAKIYERFESVQDAFLRLDTDQSGSIDAFELVRLLSQHGISVSDQEMEVLLARYDSNRDGRIDVHEFARFCQPGEFEQWNNKY
jgi:Ca2+-binding EF-hand superfamily protein